MGKVKKVVLDTAEFHPLHRNWVSLAQTIAKELNVDLEVKQEDYVYAISYGDKDDFGMAWLPQLFLEMEDGSVDRPIGVLRDLAPSGRPPSTFLGRFQVPPCPS